MVIPMCVIFFHMLQGALYILLGTNKSCIATKRSWAVMSQVWPALIQAQHSEKPSILALVDSIINKTVKNSETTAIKLLVRKLGNCLTLDTFKLD